MAAKSKKTTPGRQGIGGDVAAIQIKRFGSEAVFSKEMCRADLERFGIGSVWTGADGITTFTVVSHQGVAGQQL